MLVVIVALIFGIGGYLIGITKNTNFIVRNIEKQEATEDYKDAYKKGWSHWFSGYGMNGEGMQYIDYYEYGRNYDAVFTNDKDAFFAGYKDGFYYVNHSDPSEDYNTRIENAYEEYYSN